MIMITVAFLVFTTVQNARLWEPVYTGQSFSYGTALDLHGRVLVARGGFCEKLVEDFPMSDTVKENWLQDGPIAGQG